MAFGLKNGGATY
jgi:hypothetical protein